MEVIIFINIGKFFFLIYPNHYFFYFRNQLEINMKNNVHKLVINYQDLNSTNQNLATDLKNKPGVVIPLVSIFN